MSTLEWVCVLGFATAMVVGAMAVVWVVCAAAVLVAP